MLRATSLLVLLASAAAAQVSNARYELAWRTRALERAWLALPGPAERAGAVPLVEDAVQRFFSMDLGGAAAGLDRARLLLLGQEGGQDLERLAFTPRARLIDAAAGELGLIVTSVYATPGVGDVTLVARLGDHELRVEPASFELPEKGESQALVLDLGEGLSSLWGEARPAGGDCSIELALTFKDGQRSRRSLAVSAAADLNPRLAGLRSLLGGLPEGSGSLERATVEANVTLLERLAEGSLEETDFPAARLLSETERALSAVTKGESYYGPSLPGETWLSLPLERSEWRVRALVPQDLEPGTPVPLVVALHGAGGSENMFFDSYGDGLIVDLCRERGWLLVAPRVGFLGAPVLDLVEAFAERYPVDPERVLLIGHSMGAGLGQRVLAQDPAAFRAFAALGGGSRSRSAEALVDVPIFVGAGERDFGRRGAEALHRSLLAAGSERARLEIFPGCEHLMVVADALPAVFTWLDEQL